MVKHFSRILKPSGGFYYLNFEYFFKIHTKPALLQIVLICVPNGGELRDFVFAIEIINRVANVRFSQFSPMIVNYYRFNY